MNDAQAPTHQRVPPVPKNVTAGGASSPGGSCRAARGDKNAVPRRGGARLTFPGLIGMQISFSNRRQVAGGWRLWVAGWLVGVMLCGLSACGKKAPVPETPVASFEISPEALTQWLAQRARGKPGETSPSASSASAPSSAPLWQAGTFPLLPANGMQRLKWTFVGTVPEVPAGTTAKPIDVAMRFYLGDPTSTAVACNYLRGQVAPGPYTFTCQSALFRSEVPKTVALSVLLTRLEAFTPTVVQVDVISVSIRSGWWDWAIALLGIAAVMVALRARFYLRDKMGLGKLAKQRVKKRK
jgi:hypothetical protein